MNSAHLYKVQWPNLLQLLLYLRLYLEKKYQYLFCPLYEIIALKDIGIGNDNAYDNKNMVLLL